MTEVRACLYVNFLDLLTSSPTLEFCDFRFNSLLSKCRDLFLPAG